MKNDLKYTSYYIERRLYKIENDGEINYLINREKKFKKKNIILKCIFGALFAGSCATLSLLDQQLVNTIAFAGANIGTVVFLYNHRWQKIRERRLVRCYAKQYIEQPKSNFVDGLTPTLIRFRDIVNNPDYRERLGKYIEPLLGAFLKDNKLPWSDFVGLKTILEKEHFSKEEQLEVITFYYSRNYRYFTGEAFENLPKHQKMLPKKNHYEEICLIINSRKVLIDENGKILPYQNNLTDEEKADILSLNGYINMPQEYINAILENAQSKHTVVARKKAEQKENQILLHRELEKVYKLDHKITQLEIKNIAELLKKSGYPKAEIDKILGELNAGYEKQRQEKLMKQERIQNIQKFRKEIALKALACYLDESNKPLRIIDERTLKSIKESLKILGHDDKKISEIENRIQKNNKSNLAEIERQKWTKKRNELFEKINKDPKSKTLLLESVYTIYDQANLVVNNKNENRGLVFNFEDIKFWLDYINDYITRILDNEITVEDIEEIKMAFKELKKCLNDLNQVIVAKNISVAEKRVLKDNSTKPKNE